MSTVWTVVAVAGAATFALKAVGPVLLGGRELPAPVIGVASLLTPALLAALVATQVFGGDRVLVLDERLVGLAAAVVALVLRKNRSDRCISDLTFIDRCENNKPLGAMATARSGHAS